MSRYIETIRILNGRGCHLSRHTERLNRTRREMLGCTDHLDLAKLLVVPAGFHQGLVKCRVIYGEEIERIEFEPYAIHPVRSLKLIDAGSFDYPYKSADRSQIQTFLSARGACDDILMTRAGLITDASYANVVFRRGSHWYTPANPLLVGVMRQKLLDEGRIIPAEIWVGDLTRYSECMLINAMLEFDSSRTFPVDAIV